MKGMRAAFTAQHNKLFSIIGDPAFSEANKVFAGLLFYVFGGFSFNTFHSTKILYMRGTHSLRRVCLTVFHFPELNKFSSKNFQKLFLTHISSGLFLIKQLFHSRLLDMRWKQPTRRFAPRRLCITSYPTRVRGMIVKYLLTIIEPTGCKHSQSATLNKMIRLNKTAGLPM